MTHTDRIKQMAQEAGFDTDDAEITAPAVRFNGDPMDVSDLMHRFARLVADDCARVAYGKVAEGAAHYAHVAIRARYGLKD